MAIAGAVGGGIAEKLALRAAIPVGRGFVMELLARHHARPRRGWTAIADHPRNAALVEALGNSAGRVAGIQADRTDVKAEALPLAIEPAQVDDGVVDIGRCGLGVGDDAKPAVDGSMVEIEKALRLAIAYHVAGLRIGARHLGLFDIRFARLRLQGRVVVGFPVLYACG